VNAFRWASYLAPWVAGIAVPAALALGRLRAALVVLGVLLAVLLAASFAESPRLFLPVAAVAASVGVLAGGVHLATRSLPVAALIAPLLHAGLFVLGPVLPNIAHGPGSGPVLSWRIGLLLASNPYGVLAYSVFETDLLTLRVFYSNHLAGYPYAPPSWPPFVLAAGLAGFALGALGLRFRKAAP
jgi:hypothetical protein